MATQQDWIFLRDSLRTLDKQVKNGEVVAGPPWDLPPDLTGPQALDYLEAARRRLEEVETAVKLAKQSPIERVFNAGRDVEIRLLNAGKRALKIARDLAHASAQSFEQIVERAEKAGESISTGIGIGAGFALIVVLLLASRALGK